MRSPTAACCFGIRAVPWFSKDKACKVSIDIKGDFDEHVTNFFHRNHTALSKIPVNKREILCQYEKIN
jgi:hypothetical protein